VATVRLDDVTKVFDGVTAVDSVDLDVADHDFMILLGPSGCGKSTLLRMIAGLEDPTSGVISIGGLVVNDVEPKRRDVAMVFQSYALYPHKTVQANIEFPLKVRGVPKPERAAQARVAAEALDLTEYLGRKPGQLSGGQRQRVALDQVEAMTMGLHVAVMSRGRIEQVGTPQDVYARPATVFVAQFIGTPPMNIFPAGMVEPGDTLVGARPEHIAFDDASPLRASVGLVEQLGHEALVNCHIGETRVIVRVPAAGVVHITGSDVGLHVPPEHRHRFDATTRERISA
jgi:ABC-type sugar transport system ATPase subunit